MAGIIGGQARRGSAQGEEMSIEEGLPVSVVVPVRRGGAAFAQCLASVGRCRPAPAELIVVVDGADEDAQRLAREAGARVIALPASRGPARARNAGARAASGEVLLFLDSDVTVQPDAVARVAAAFRDDASLAALFGSYDDAPAAGNFLSQYKNLMHHYVHQRGREEAFTFWAACGAMRRSVFEAVGGYDERYSRPCVEDIELGYRLVAAGQRIRLLKDLQVKHHKVWTIGSLLKADILYRALPWTELILTHRRAPSDLNLSWSARLSVLLAWAMLAALVGGAFRPWLFAGAGGLAVLLLAVNLPVYRFLYRKRGLWFVVRAVPWHWAYYVYGGLAFAVGLVRRVLRCRRAPWLHAGAPPVEAAAKAERS